MTAGSPTWDEIKAVIHAMAVNGLAETLPEHTPINLPGEVSQLFPDNLPERLRDINHSLSFPHMLIRVGRPWRGETILQATWRSAGRLGIPQAQRTALVCATTRVFGMPWETILRVVLLGTHSTGFLRGCYWARLAVRHPNEIRSCEIQTGAALYNVGMCPPRFDIVVERITPL